MLCFMNQFNILRRIINLVITTDVLSKQLYLNEEFKFGFFVFDSHNHFQINVMK